MNRVLKAMSGSLVALVSMASLAGAQETRRTILAVDVSGSSTFLYDTHSADAAGDVVERYIGKLDAPHDLVMVSVGDAGLARRAVDVRATVTQNRATSAKALSKQFGGFFRSLPGLVQRGAIAPQDTTSLIAFLQSLEPVCAAGNATVILFSDGIEWSSSLDGRALLTGKASLPKPDSAFLKGCEVRMLGVGEVKATLDATGLAARLIPQWRAYLTAAGAAPVSVVGSGFSF